MVAVVEHVGHAFVIRAVVSSSRRLLDDPDRVVKIVAVQEIGVQAALRQQRMVLLSNMTGEVSRIFLG
jgi:hypothetical protein